MPTTFATAPRTLTVFLISYDPIQCPYKVGEYGIDVVEARQDVYDVGARVRIFLGQEAGEVNGQSLLRVSGMSASCGVAAKATVAHRGHARARGPDRS